MRESDTALPQKRCVPCSRNTPPLEGAAIDRLLPQVPGWSLTDGVRLTKQWMFASFRQARSVVNRIAAVAEEEGHHPDILWRFRTVAIELTTHAIRGLSENDFILAAKIDGTIKAKGEDRDA